MHRESEPFVTLLSQIEMQPPPAWRADRFSEMVYSFTVQAGVASDSRALVSLGLAVTVAPIIDGNRARVEWALF